jgi:hypothetical protein
MHTGQKYALNLGHVYAHRAEVCPESQAHLCTLCRSMNRIQDKVSPPEDGLPEISDIKNESGMALFASWLMIPDKE